MQRLPKTACAASRARLPNWVRKKKKGGGEEEERGKRAILEYPHSLWYCCPFFFLIIPLGQFRASASLTRCMYTIQYNTIQYNTTQYNTIQHLCTLSVSNVPSATYIHPSAQFERPPAGGASREALFPAARTGVPSKARV